MSFFANEAYFWAENQIDKSMQVSFRYILHEFEMLSILLRAYLGIFSQFRGWVIYPFHNILNVACWNAAWKSSIKYGSIKYEKGCLRLHHRLTGSL